MNSNLTVSASHVAKVLGAAHSKAVVDKPRGFGVVYETTMTPGFQVFTHATGSVAVAHRMLGDDNPSAEVSAAMLAAFVPYKRTLRANGFHGEVVNMERTGYPCILVTSREAVAKAPADAPAEAPPAVDPA